MYQKFWGEKVEHIVAIPLNMAEKIIDEAFKKKKIITIGAGYYCGEDLKSVLRRGKLSNSDITEIINGIFKFHTTTLAFSKDGEIIEWDHYHEHAYWLRRIRGRAIVDTIAEKHRIPFTLIFYDNYVKNGEPCLKISETMRYLL